MLAPCRHICILVYVADAQLIPSEDVAACHEGSHACTGTGSRLGTKDRQQGGGTTCITHKEQDAQPQSTCRQGTKAGLTRSAIERRLVMCYMLKQSGTLQSPLQIPDASGRQPSNACKPGTCQHQPRSPLASGNTTLTLGRQEWLNMEASR